MLRSGKVSAKEFAAVTKLGIKQAEAALSKVDKDNDKAFSRAEFHDMMNRGRIRQPSLSRGDRAFKSLDKNGVCIQK